MVLKVGFKPFRYVITSVQYYTHFIVFPQDVSLAKEKGKPLLMKDKASKGDVQKHPIGTFQALLANQTCVRAFLKNENNFVMCLACFVRLSY